MVLKLLLAFFTHQGVTEQASQTAFHVDVMVGMEGSPRIPRLRFGVALETVWGGNGFPYDLTLQPALGGEKSPVRPVITDERALGEFPLALGIIGMMGRRRD